MNYYFIDLFCGAGGVTSGIVKAGAKVIACVNHDPLAIQSHKTNHPDVLHFTEDIRTLNMDPLIHLVNELRKEDPACQIDLWASLECTNFSKAKGGQPRDGDSRTLAEHLDRYIIALSPDKIWIENVVEFMSWGPLDENGKPVSKKNGSDYVKWCNHIQEFGYSIDYNILNAADYGAYTSRIRYFAQFARPGIPIVWPMATHAKKPGNNGMFGNLYKWKAVKDVLDFTDEGESIFTRKTFLVEKSLERIYAGLIKYVANGDTNFIAKYYSGDPNGKVISVNSPASTIRTKDSQSLIQTEFLLKYNSTDSKGNHTPPSIEDPSPTIACQGRLGIIRTEFLTKYYSNGDNIQSVETPVGTLTTKDRFTKIKPCWLDKQYSGPYNHQSIEQPAGTVLITDKHSLVQSELLEEIKHFIVNPQYTSAGISIEKPCFTLIAKMDKRPPILITTLEGKLAIEIFETDSVMTIKIKQFMAAYGIVDIKMRMLRIKELLKIQGFNDSYFLAGNQSDQKRFIGNSVEVTVAAALIGANITEYNYRIKVA